MSAWCEVRAAERASKVGRGHGRQGQGGGLRAERGFPGGLCECLVQGEGAERASKVRRGPGR